MRLAACAVSLGSALEVGRSRAVVLSFLYWALRRLLEVLVLRMRSERAKEIEILVLRHQLQLLERQVVVRNFGRLIARTSQSFIVDDEPRDQANRNVAGAPGSDPRTTPRRDSELDVGSRDSEGSTNTTGPQREQGFETFQPAAA
jgi:hypothetical protein